MNLLRTAAQMLAMWTKGPWERDGEVGSGAGVQMGGLAAFAALTFIAPGTTISAGNTEVSNIDILPSQNFIPERKGGD